MKDSDIQSAAPDAKFMSRRSVISLIGSALTGAIVVGCSGGSGDSASEGDSIGAASGSSSGDSCTSTLTTTNGPFPADGTNSNSGSVVDALSQSGIVRSNIVSDIGGSNTQSGVPLTVTLTLENLNNSCAAVSNYYIYIWQCNKAGVYSAYNDTFGETFLRGVQETDSNGQVTFTTIFPGRYTGRVNHIHVEVYSSSGLTVASKVLTTQYCFPDAIDTSVDSYYGNTNSASLTNQTDGIFGSDYAALEFDLSGSIADGYTATATIGIAV